MKNSAEDILQQFKNKINLSDYLSNFISLEKRGNSFVGKCPFHNEKTPSFSVSNEKGLFYCFGCGVGGNVFTFLKKYKNISFQEALKTIADYLGIELKTVSSKEIGKITNLYNLLANINQVFKANLENNSFARNYLKKRGIDHSSIKKFNIGLCNQDLGNFNKILNLKGFSENDIKEAGLIIESNEDKRLFLRFQNRITFPIYNMLGKVVGFGGRTIVNSKIKYINSPESILFKKSDNIYGLWQNKESIKNRNNLFLVEGYLDVISLYSKKVDNSVATLGTSLSQTQIEKIWSYTNNPIMCYDGDNAGLRAMNQLSLKILKFLKPGKTMKFMTLPDGDDPDSFIQKNSKEEFYNYSNQSLNLSDLIWSNILDETDNITPEYSALIESRIKKITSSINDSNLSQEYYKYLISKRNDYFWNKRKIISKKSLKKSDNKESFEKFKNINECIVLSFLIFEKELSIDFIEQIDAIMFNDPTLNKNKSDILSFYFSNSRDIDQIKEKLNESEWKKFNYVKNTHFKHLDYENKKLFLRDIILNLRLPMLLNEREKLKKEILQSKESENSEEYIKKYENLSKEINKIKSK